MKKLMIMLAVMTVGFSAVAQELIEKKRKLLLDPSEGAIFTHGTHSREQSAVAKHLGKGETVRNYHCGIKGGFAPVIGQVSTINWTKFNYLIFDVFCEGTKSWKGYFWVSEGGNASGPGGTGRHIRINVEFKPGENKEYRVKLTGRIWWKGTGGSYVDTGEPAHLGSMGGAILFNCLDNKESASIPLYIGKFYLVKYEEVGEETK